MACWVVPTVAADYLGIPLRELYDRVERGAMATRTEGDFSFVDVAPTSPTMIGRDRFAPPPPTYSATADAVVARDERAALKARPADRDDGPEDQNAAETPEAGDLGDWRAVRRAVSRLRVAPRKAPLRAA